MRRRHGLTLVELLFTTALLGILMTLAVGAILVVQRTAEESGFQAVADQEIKMLSDWLAASVRGAGGHGLEPHMAVMAENDVGESRADRLSWADVDPDLSACTLLAHDGLLSYAVDVDREDGACCLGSALAGRQAMLISVDGDAWRSLRMEQVSEVAGACSVTFAAEGTSPTGSSIPASGLLAASDGLPADEDLDGLFEGGTLLVVDVLRVSVDTARSELLLEEDRDPLDGDFESRLMMDRVYDLQVALGYDSTPRDGQVSNSAASLDEWLGNSEGDAFGEAGLAGARVDDLRMVSVGFVHGSPTDTSHSNPVRLMDGRILSQSAVVLRAHTSRVALRNRVPFQ